MESWFHNETVEYGQASTYRASAVVIRMWKKGGSCFETREGNVLQYRADAPAIP